MRRFERGGGSVAEFCRREGVSEATFSWWRRRLAESAFQRGATGGCPAGFVPVQWGRPVSIGLSLLKIGVQDAVNSLRIPLGQVATEEKSNEITAIPQRLEIIDAAGCQKNIAAQIVRGGGGYVLALKGNQGRRFDKARSVLDDAIRTGMADGPVSITSSLLFSSLLSFASFAPLREALSSPHPRPSFPHPTPHKPVRERGGLILAE